MEEEKKAADPTEVQSKWYWVKDAAGHGSVTVTLVFVSFWVTTLAYVLSMFETLGPIHVRPFDVAACASYFAPILALYFGRRYTDAKLGNPNIPQAEAPKGELWHKRSL